MSLSQLEQEFVERVFNMDPAEVTDLIGCHPAIAERVPFRAWMWITIQLIESGPIVMSRYDTASDVIVAYAMAAGATLPRRYHGTLAKGA